MLVSVMEISFLIGFCWSIVRVEEFNIQLKIMVIQNYDLVIVKDYHLISIEDCDLFTVIT
jgi:hypothetical protein